MSTDRAERLFNEGSSLGWFPRGGGYSVLDPIARSEFDALVDRVLGKQISVPWVSDVEPGQTIYVQLATREGEMVLHVSVTVDGRPRIVLREGGKSTLLLERA